MPLYDKVFHIDDFHGQGGTFTNGCFDIIHKGHIKLFEFCHSVSKSNVNRAKAAAAQVEKYIFDTFITQTNA